MHELAIVDFLDYIRSEKGLSPHTIEAYGRDIQSFAQSLIIKDWKQVAPEQVLGFLGQLKSKNYASSTICRMLVAVKVFFRFLKKEGVISVKFSGASMMISGTSCSSVIRRLTSFSKLSEKACMFSGNSVMPAAAKWPP